MPDNNKPVSTPMDIVTVDIFNPTRARRVIYDGIGENPKPIVIEVGETKKNVKVTRLIEQELRERNKIKKDSDLVLTRSESIAA